MNTPKMETQYPADLTVPWPERSSRWLALATLLFLIPKGIMLTPHFVILWALSIAAVIVGLLAQIVVLLTGRYPRGMHDFVGGFYRWQWRVGAFFFGLTDKYPPFSLR